MLLEHLRANQRTFCLSEVELKLARNLKQIEKLDRTLGQNQGLFDNSGEDRTCDVSFLDFNGTSCSSAVYC